MPQDMTPAQTMEAQGNAPAGEPICPCNGGNRYWLENSSGQSLSTTFSAGGVASPVLPQTSATDTRAVNTLSGSGGQLQMSINGESCTVLDNVDTGMMSAPEDLRAGLVVGQRRAAPPAPLSSDSRGIAFSDAVEEVDIGRFLPEGVSSGDTEIDLVVVLQTAPGAGVMPPGQHSVESLNEEQAGWFLKSLLINTLTNSADGARATLDDVRRAFQVRTLAQMRAVVSEVVFGARFTVKPIASWGGQLAIVFKGRHTGRAFLTAIMYGLRNTKMGYVSSYAQVAGAINTGSGGAAAATNAARGVAKGNMIGFLIATVVEVSDFIASEDPEKNWGDVLGGLSVAFTKVWVAGFVGVLAAGAFAASVAAAPVILVVAVGVGAAIVVGIALDWADEALGISEGARKIGRAFGNALYRGAAAVGAFVDRVVQSSVSWLERTVDEWNASFQQAVDEVIDEARRNDPRGYCALFCSNPLDQARAWQGLFR